MAVPKYKTKPGMGNPIRLVLHVAGGNVSCNRRIKIIYFTFCIFFYSLLITNFLYDKYMIYFHFNI